MQFPGDRRLRIERSYEPDEDAVRRAVDILLRDVREETEDDAA